MQAPTFVVARSPCVYSSTHQCHHLDIRLGSSAMASHEHAASCIGSRDFLLRVSAHSSCIRCSFSLRSDAECLCWLAVTVYYCTLGSRDAGSTNVVRSTVLACSAASDRLYYGVWTLPPLRFLYFNIAQSLAVFYGKNRADYYLTEGLPLLLTTVLPFAVVGLWHSLKGAGPSASSKASESSSTASAVEGSDSARPDQPLARLAWTCIIVTVVLSMISHKEVRFLYPILPFLHIIAGEPLALFLPRTASPLRKLAIAFLLATNILLAGYVSLVHQRGVIDVLAHLRHRHESRNALSLHPGTTNPPISNTTVAFLMPCHSTPWRSHLVYPEINAWALTCEPPLNIPLTDRATYLDEADQFYISPGPVSWLRSNMENIQTISAEGSRSGQHWAGSDPRFKQKYRRAWPQNLVFFAQLEGTMKEVLGGTRYRECWRGFNTHVHDDSRRTGDVVVWCLDGG